MNKRFPEGYTPTVSQVNLARAILDHPEGRMCGACSGVNTFADDAGWYYQYVGEQYVPVCASCIVGPAGDR